VTGISLDRGVVLIDRGPIIERVRGSDEGVEQSWQFESPPPGRGDLHIRFRVDAAFRGQTKLGLHFGDPAEGGVRYGLASWQDARGRSTSIEPRWEGSFVDIVVPADIIEGTQFPAVLDPLLSPEIDLDQPLHVRESLNAYDPQVAFGNGLFLVVWHDDDESSPIGRSVRGVRVRESDGQILDPLPILIEPRWSRQASVAFDGSSNFFVAYVTTSTANIMHYHVRARRVRAIDGAVLDASPIDLSGEVPWAGDAVVAWSGSFLVAWLDGRNGHQDVYARRVTATGVPLNPFVIASSPAQQDDLVMTSGGGTFFVAFTRNASPNGVALGARIRSDGVVLDPGGVQLNVSSGDHPVYGCASDGRYMFTVWGGPAIYGRRMAISNGALDATETTITVAGERFASIVFDGTNYDLSWIDNSNFYLGRVSPSLALIDGPSGVAVDTSNRGSFPPVIGVGPSNVVLAFDADVSGYPDVFARRYDRRTLAALDTQPLLLSKQAAPQFAPSAAYAAGTYLVAWIEFPFGQAQPWTANLYGARIRADDGAILDPNGIEIIDGAFSANVGVAYAPSVASNGVDFLVATEQLPSGNIVAARVRSSDGLVLDSPPITVRTSTEGRLSPPRPRVAFGGGRYVVVWRETVNDPSLGAIDRGVRARRVDPSGVLLDSAPIVLGYDPTLGYGLPEVACQDPSCLVVWEGLTPQLQDGYRGARIDLTSGVVLDSPPLDFNSSNLGGSGVTIASGEGYYLATWVNGSLFARRIRADGFALGVPVATVSSEYGIANPTVAYDGADFLIAFSVGTDIKLSRVQLPSTVLDNPSILTATIGAGSTFTVPLSLTTGAIATTGVGQSLIAYAQYQADQRFAPRIKGRFFVDLALGQTCSSGAQCSTSLCVDGVCCDSSCGGGDPTDCEACSRVAGAPADGRCSVVPGYMCRPSMFMCDPPEFCTVTSTLCPPDIISGGCADAGIVDSAIVDSQAPDTSPLSSDSNVESADVEPDAEPAEDRDAQPDAAFVSDADAEGHRSGPRHHGSPFGCSAAHRLSGRPSGSGQTLPFILVASVGFVCRGLRGHGSVLRTRKHGREAKHGVEGQTRPSN
jgi:hypothetical protein